MIPHIIAKDGDGIPLSIPEYINIKVIEAVSGLRGNCDGCKHNGNGTYTGDCDGCIRGVTTDNYSEYQSE